MKSWITKSFLVALALLLTSEFITRVLFAERMSGRFEYGYHPTAGFVEKIGTLYLVKSGGRRFFDQKLSIQRPTETFRAFVIGDSVARGGNPEACYGGQLAKELRLRGFQAESANMALPGYGGHRKLVVLRQALNYQPSLVILHVGNSNEYEDEREYKRSEEFKTWHPKNWLMKIQVVRRLYEVKTEKVYWRWLPQAIRNQRLASDKDAEVAASINPEKLKQWDERVKRFTSESVALAREKHVPILLVSQATRLKRPDGTAYLDDQGMDQLANSLVGDGVYHLSMKEALIRAGMTNDFMDSAHMNPPAHTAMGKAIADLVQEKQLVPAK
ncbi:MAG: SGNH/GDSL hydrolase family protein [Verrucomicrobiota bacterium]